MCISAPTDEKTDCNGIDMRVVEGKERYKENEHRQSWRQVKEISTKPSIAGCNQVGSEGVESEGKCLRGPR